MMRGQLSVYRKVIVGYDGREQSKDALALGKLLADTTGAELVLAGVFPSHQDAAADADFACEIERAAAAVGARAEAIPSSSPARGLYELAEELEADLVVVGSSSRAGLGHVLAGSVAQRLLHGASCAVAVAPRGLRHADPRLRVLAVGYDGAPESKEALSVAIELARAAEATMRLFSAAGPPSTGLAGTSGKEQERAVREHLRDELDEALHSVPDKIRPAAELLAQEAVVGLLEEAEKGVDLLCLGSRGYGPVRRVLLGSVSARLVEAAPCPVLVVPRGAGVSDGEQREPIAQVAP